MTELQDLAGYSQESALPRFTDAQIQEMRDRLDWQESVLIVLGDQLGISIYHPSMQPPSAGTVDA